MRAISRRAGRTVPANAPHLLNSLAELPLLLGVEYLCHFLVHKTELLVNAGPSLRGEFLDCRHPAGHNGFYLLCLFRRKPQFFAEALRDQGGCLLWMSHRAEHSAARPLMRQDGGTSRANDYSTDKNQEPEREASPGPRFPTRG